MVVGVPKNESADSKVCECGLPATAHRSIIEADRRWQAGDNNLKIMKIIDPRGFLIFLEPDCWSKHILKRHPVMEEHKRELIATLKDPDFIYESNVDEFSELYFKKFKIKDYEGVYIMAVVDKSKGKVKMFVKTGFIVYNLTKGKKLLWTKK